MLWPRKKRWDFKSARRILHALGEKKNDFKSADPNPYELGGTSKALGPFCMIWTQTPNPPLPFARPPNR